MCAGVGSGGFVGSGCNFRKVPEGSCAGVGSRGRFRKVAEGSGVC